MGIIGLEKGRRSKDKDISEAKRSIVLDKLILATKEKWLRKRKTI